MKLSLNWIKEFVDIPIDSHSEAFDLELSKLVYDLTMSTVEVEEAVNLKDMFDKMVIGVVKEIKPHPDADKLVLCQVDVGDSLLREIVCGGINLSEGMKVAVARPGAKVRWHGEGDLIELKIAKVRGIESYGMICASSEIGLYDLFPYTQESTIVDLSDFDAPAGTDLAAALGLDDVILTIDNKSLTNRPDLWGHYGIARELSAIYGLKLKEYSHSTLHTPHSTLKISIADPNLCPRYIGVKIENVSPEPAPFEMQSRLWRVGVRPINAIVDITNYVMLETGQPTHAFDADVVKGGIIVRPAKEGEKLTLLDGSDLTLSEKDLVIADETEAIALAGVMGGEKDSVLPDTKSIILELANFNPLSVRHTAMRYDVRTEAATRFEKGIDPQRADIALSSAMRLFTEIYPQAQTTGYNDNYPKSPQQVQIDVSQAWLEKRLGRKLPADKLSGILERLGFETAFSGDIMTVTVPSWRATGDVSIPDDIMEEVARIYGLENFEPTPIVTAFEKAINQPDVDIDRKIRQYLACSCGANEVYTYPWISEEFITATIGSTDGMIEMSAPPSPDERFLRSSLIPGLCKAVSDNLRYFDEFSIFESAQVFFDKDYTAVYDKREQLPMQRRHVAGAFVAPREQYGDIYRRVKGVLEALPCAVKIPDIGFEQPDNAQKPLWADEVVWQCLTHQNAVIGDMGLLSQKAALACGIKNSAVMLFALDIDALGTSKPRELVYAPAPVYPMAEFDVSLLFDTQTKWEDIYKTALGKPGPDNLVRDVGFVEEYKSDKIAQGKKSITLRLTIGSDKKTLTSEEIEACANAVTKRLCKTMAAEKRV